MATPELQPAALAERIAELEHKVNGLYDEIGVLLQRTWPDVTAADPTEAADSTSAVYDLETVDNAPAYLTTAQLQTAADGWAGDWTAAVAAEAVAIKTADLGDVRIITAPAPTITPGTFNDAGTTPADPTMRADAL